MRREIKFRAKRKDSQEWVYGHLFKTPLTAENFESDSFQCGHERWCIARGDGSVCEIDINTLGQYTGWKDINNKEIYEGDVDKFGQVVSFTGGRFLLIDEKGNHEDLLGNQDEIIGTVYSKNN